ncbi:hypothetical protein FB451DRAFT_1385725 [Mycena latifolia]|nr:hypothetical protein FB451DRAFT_1385725 [Mycena latifolia]
MVSFLSTRAWAVFIFHGLLAALADPGIVSSSWRKPEISLSSVERMALASAALDKSISALPTTTAFRVYYQMAEFDIVTIRQNWQNQTFVHLVSIVMQALSRKNTFASRSVGHAAIRAYAAYKNPVFLAFANESWAFARSYTISPDDIVSESVTGKDFSLQTTCQGASMVGGTFDTSNSTDSSITGLASTYFLVLSALLAEATSDPLYLNAALKSLDFISVHLADAQNLVQDGISGSQDDACALDSTPNSFNTGLMIEGLSALCSVTSNALNDVITATISSDAWQTADGILARGASKLGDMYVVRGLAAAYTRNTMAPDIRTYVHDYLGVQFNAAVDLATSNGNNIYGGAWTGPPSAIFSQSNQTGAISALLGGISLLPPNGSAPASSTPSPSSPPTAPMAPRARRIASAVIAGAVVGSVALFAIGFGIWFFLRRRARTARPISFAPTTMTTASTPHPFTARSTTFVSSASPTLPRPSLPKLAVSPTEIAPAHQHDRPVQSPAEAITSASLASAVDGPTNVRSLTSPPDSGSLTSPVNLPTTELVRLLNERLRNRQWDEEEPPPEYGTERDV